MSEPLAGVSLRHNQVVVNDVRLHYVEAGPEDGHLVVCLHGFPEFWYSWRYQIPALVEAGYHVVAPDMRGYNTSEKPYGIESYAIDYLVDDIVDLIQYLDHEVAHVVGHDWGGGVSWQLGMDHPDVVNRLVVMNAPHPAVFARELDLAQLRRSWYMFFFQLPGLPEWVASRGNMIEQLFREQPTNPEAFTDDDIQRYTEAFTQPGSPTSTINYYRAYLRSIAGPMAKCALPLVGRFFDPPGNKQITVPTLVLWGEQDKALGVGLSEGLDEWVPDVQVERFPDASHWVQCDVPDQVNESLVAFLDEAAIR